MDGPDDGYAEGDDPDYGYPEGEEGKESRPRDSKIDEARQVLIDVLFETHPHTIFFQRQIQVRFENQFFHWITAKALGELAEEGRIKTIKERLLHPAHESGSDIRFYASRRNRYWKRQARTAKKLVQEYSNSQFARAIGDQGELMFDAILAEYGFTINGRNVSEYEGNKWTDTNQNLDRIYVRDGIAYGAEVKNTLDYIPHAELRAKIRIAQTLRVRPLFIMRFAPKSYVFEIIQNGGFALLFENQLYPFGHYDLAKRVRTRLGLPVECRRRIEDGHIIRFLKWHQRLLRDPRS